jgi:hypothetical protein
MVLFVLCNKFDDYSRTRMVLWFKTTSCLEKARFNLRLLIIKKSWLLCHENVMNLGKECCRNGLQYADNLFREKNYHQSLPD